MTRLNNKKACHRSDLFKTSLKEKVDKLVFLDAKIQNGINISKTSKKKK